MITFLIIWLLCGFLAWKIGVYISLNYDRDPITVEDVLAGGSLCALFGPGALATVVLYFLFSGDYDLKWMKKEVYPVPKKEE